MLTVTVDRNLCVSAGQCVTLVPEAFELDDDYKSRPLPEAAEAGAAVLHAAADLCPSGAITVVSDADGGL